MEYLLFARLLFESSYRFIELSKLIYSSAGTIRVFSRSVWKGGGGGGGKMRYVEYKGDMMMRLHM